MNSNLTAVSFYINAISIGQGGELHINVTGDINTALGYFHTGAFIEVSRTVLNYQLAGFNGCCTINSLFKQRSRTGVITLFSHQYQLVVACINGQRCFYLYSIFSCSVNRSVSTENVLTILDIACIFGICCSITGQSSSEFCFRRNYRCCRFNIGALAIFLIEGDVAALQCCGGSSQAVGNLHITGQVLFTGYKVAIGQLACQCVQYVGYTCIVIHADAGVVGDQRYYRAFCCVLDNGVACCVVACIFTIAGVCIEDVGVATVVINGQVIAVLLEDVACSCSACTACEVRYTAACPFFAAPRIFDNRINYFVVPGCAVLQPQVCCTGEG